MRFTETGRLAILIMIGCRDKVRNQTGSRDFFSTKYN